MGADPERAHALLRSYGRAATSFQILERGTAHWFSELPGLVGYVDTGRVWVVVGAPVGPAERLAEVAAEFEAAAARAGRRVAYVAAEADFLAVAPRPGAALGEQPVWVPARWAQSLAGARSLREQLRRARAKQVRVRRVEPFELAPEGPLAAALGGLLARWQDHHPLPPLGFMVQLDLESGLEARRTYVAEREGALVGLLCAVPVYARAGWFFEDLLRAPDAPNGTMELLFDAAVRDVDASGAGFVTLGLAPLSGPGRGRALLRRLARPLYDFDGLRAFKAKLRPDHWETLYLARGPGLGSLRALFHALRALVGPAPGRYLLAALRRRRRRRSPR